jgi:hypothetical protein
MTWYWVLALVAMSAVLSALGVIGYLVWSDRRESPDIDPRPYIDRWPHIPRQGRP